ncbi:MAG: amidoligase family protein, partial [Marinobacter sp.]|nr:amidoligase family protein [Marinobacter sp.]
MTQASSCKMPDVLKTQQGQDRRVGVEIELSGMSYDALVSRVSGFFGAKPRLVSRYVTEIDTAFGTFTIELDSDPIKELDLADDRLPDSIRDIGGQAMEVIDAAAER